MIDESDRIKEENIRLPAGMRQVEWLGRKTRLFDLFDKLEPYGAVIYRNSSKIMEIGGSFTLGLGLGQLNYANTPEDIGRSVVYCAAGGFVALMGGVIDLVDWRVNRSLNRKKDSKNYLDSEDN